MEEYKVSRITVRQAISALVAEGVLSKQQGRGTFVVQTRRKKIAAQRKNVGLLIYEPALGVLGLVNQLIGCINDAAQDNDLNIILTPVNEKILSRKDGVSEIVEEKGLDGLVITAEEIPDEVLERLRKQTIPFLLLLRESSANNPFLVKLDIRDGVLKAMAALAEKGHRRVAFLGGHLSASPVAGEKLAAYRDALKNFGMEQDEGLIREVGYEGEGTFAATRELLALPSSPTAIFISDSFLSFGVYEACVEIRRQIPGDLSIIGMNESPFAKTLKPSLATVEVPVREIAASACSLLKEIFDPQAQGRTIMLKHHLYPRESVAGANLKLKIKN
ncbi:MAG: substrate-binding domain-containing protein [Verrucomicrobiae bacterium]|nr:substrate-binding domain-containing protein [Verrucomicrobiae bacterium]